MGILTEKILGYGKWVVMNYIKEIQGLRAVAALLVAVYHIWLNRVSGGVDAFFVIAAFFLMTSFARIGQPSRMDMLRYWAATVRRVVPLAAVVILSTIAGTLLITPHIHWREFAFHAFSSAVFVENWWLAWTGTDYLRLDQSVSPFQQMWALSLQMQYYLVLPIILWSVAALAARLGLAVRAAWTTVLLGILILSFAYSLWITATNQPWAYFDSAARGWEYMAGALLALHLDRLPRLSQKTARLLGYACLLILVGFAAVIPVARAFPGVAALIPVVSTVGLIAAARAGAGIAALTNKPIMALGEISFSFYLWHWPLLILWRQWTGETAVGIAPGVSIILLAGILAWLTLRFIEAPFRRWQTLVMRPGLSIVAGALIMLPAIGTTYLWADANRIAVRKARADLAAFTADPRTRLSDVKILPDPLIARDDIPGGLENSCQQSLRASSLIECNYGSENASRTLVLVGNSHAMQWLPALQNLTFPLDFQVITMTKSDCPLLDASDKSTFMAADEQVDFIDASSCLDWNIETLDRIIGLAPDLVLTISTAGTASNEAVPAAFRTVWADLNEAGIPVLALRDNPRFTIDVIECVSRFVNKLDACDEPRTRVISKISPTNNLNIAGVTFVDFSDLFCNEIRCWAVRDGILIYRDRSHITSTFARAHASRLGKAIESVIGKP